MAIFYLQGCLPHESLLVHCPIVKNARLHGLPSLPMWSEPWHGPCERASLYLAAANVSSEIARRRLEVSVSMGRHAQPGRQGAWKAGDGSNIRNKCFCGRVWCSPDPSSAMQPGIHKRLVRRTFHNSPQSRAGVTSEVALLVFTFLTWNLLVEFQFHTREHFSYNH